MKVIKKYVFVLIFLIVFAAFFFLIFSKKKSLDILYLSETENSIMESVASFQVLETLSAKINLNKCTLNFKSEAVNSTEEFELKFKNHPNESKSDILFMDLNYSEKLLSTTSVDFDDQFVLSLFFKKADQIKESVNILPDIVQIMQSLNVFCELSEDSNVLFIDEYLSDYDVTEILNGNIYTLPFNTSYSTRDGINEIISSIETYNPDYLILNTNDSNTITILDSIVGFPRNKIFLMLQNTNKKTGYYTGINSFGVNGIAVTDDLDSEEFNNKSELLKMVSLSIAQYIEMVDKFDKNQWIAFQNNNPDSIFSIKNDQVVTELYHVRFKENGFDILGKF